MKMTSRLVLFLLMLLALSACGADEAGAPARDDLLSFAATIEPVGREVAFELGAYNGGNPLPENEQFGGVWTLRGPGAEDLRASGEVHLFPAIGGGQEVWPVSWQGELEPGDYQLIWGAPGYGTTYQDFTISHQNGGILIETVRVFDTTEDPPKTVLNTE